MKRKENLLNFILFDTVKLTILKGRVLYIIDGLNLMISYCYNL